MHCPICNDPYTKVIDSRVPQEGVSVRRRRKCDKCEHRFTTFEMVQLQLPAVVKEDGRRENFNRDKILSGLNKACQKRPISVDSLNELIDDLSKDLLDTGKDEVVSRDVGRMTMAKLIRLDPVAYVRFASFYWDFKNIDGFIKNLKDNMKSDQNQIDLRPMQ